jgi:hypothetical protein
MVSDADLFDSSPKGSVIDCEVDKRTIARDWFPRRPLNAVSDRKVRVVGIYCLDACILEAGLAAVS